MPRIVLINGDGIGGEVIPAAHQVLAALNLPLEFVYADAGFGTFEKTGNALPDETIQLVPVRRLRVVRRDAVAHDQS